MHHRTLLGLVAVTATALLSACGDNDSGATTTVATTTNVIGSSGPGAGTAFCEINAEINASPSPLDGTATAAEVEEFFTGFFSDAMSRAKAAAPPEISSDVDILVAGIADITAFLESKNWDVDAAYADSAFIALFSADEFTQAGTRVDTYCGIG